MSTDRFKSIADAVASLYSPEQGPQTELSEISVQNGIHTARENLTGCVLCVPTLAVRQSGNELTIFVPHENFFPESQEQFLEDLRSKVQDDIKDLTVHFRVFP